MLLKNIRAKLARYSFKEIVRLFDDTYGLGAIENKLAQNWFNPFATLWLNLRTLKFRHALRFPIAVYGRPRLYSLAGNIVINGDVRTGMIKFNQVRLGSPNLQSTQSELHLRGTIIFNGPGIIGTGNRIFVERNATLKIGKHFKITDMVNIGCLYEISIGNQSWITHRCQIFDSNYHLIANFNKDEIPYHSKPIHIGDGCWICNSTTITGGSTVPDFTIVGSNSLVNHNLKDVPTNSIVAGSPAEVLSTGFRRVDNYNIEQTVFSFYNRNQGKKIFTFTEDFTPEICSTITKR